LFQLQRVYDEAANKGWRVNCWRTVSLHENRAAQAVVSASCTCCKLTAVSDHVSVVCSEMPRQYNTSADFAIDYLLSANGLK